MAKQKLALALLFAASCCVAAPPTTSTMGFGGKQAKPDDAAPDSPPEDADMTIEAGDGTAPQLKMGEKMSFPEFGPIIVNSDGSTRRITNWDQMTSAEQERTMKRISKRNAERIAALEKQRAGETEPGADDTSAGEPAADASGPSSATSGEL